MNCLRKGINIDSFIILLFKKIIRVQNLALAIIVLNNSYLNPFINGITIDTDAIRNAIIYEYNNGLTEGSVNKLKVIKK